MKKHMPTMAAALVLAACSAEPAGQSEATDVKAVVQTVYTGFAAGDIPMVLGVMAPDVQWNEAEGNPYADGNPYSGPEAVASGLFARLGSEWEGFTATPGEFVTEGSRVVVFGRYGGTYGETGQALDAPFVHSWTVEGGKIVSFDQYTDTEEFVAVMER